MARYLFLSDEWVKEARRIRAEHRGDAGAVAVPVRMNQVIQEVPFGEGVLHAHLDTTSGEYELETGHLEQPDLTITVGYETAKAILVQGDVQAAMQAWLSGRIKVDGDVTKLLLLQQAAAANPDPAAAELARRLQEITE